MKLRSAFFLTAAVTTAGLLASAAGCKLIAKPDRSTIPEGAGGGTGTGGAGGSGGSTTSGGGMGGMGGGMGGQGGTGGGPECTGTDTTNCPAPSGECVVAVCNNDGTCGEMPAPQGTVAATQVDFDCKQNVCDANGNVVTSDDNNDIADDNETCTTDTCDAGNPVHTPVALNTACGAGGTMFCSAAGTCVECNSNPQCASGVCQNNACVPAACNDNVQNGNETDTDCGGGTCGPCAVGDTCDVGSDCITLVCNTTCQAASCSDSTLNQDETDVDCGGTCGATCLVNDSCVDDGDCMTGYCDLSMNMCMVPTCSDGVQNQGETGVDCGGPCLACNGAACAANADCSSGMCYELACVASVNGCNINTAVDLTGVSATAVTFPNGNLTYNPKCIKVKANPVTTVTFNGSFSSHPLIGGTVTGGVGTPGSSGPFVPVTNTGTTADFVMNAEGTYPYYCTAHAANNMTGAVFVVP